MAKGIKQTAFNKAWLQDPDFSSWIAEASKYKAKCTVCNVLFELGNMGKKALRSHAKGKKHQSLANMKETQHNSLLNFLPKSQKTASKFDPVVPNSPTGMNSARPLTEAPFSDAHASCTQSIGLKEKKDSQLLKYVNKDEVLTSEILWALKCATSHFSFNSSDHTNKLFKRMFPDSDIAQRFTCNSTKCSYLISFGLAPYFQNELVRKVKNAEFYVLSFDESLNTFIKEEQMDLFIRFWDNELQRVVTHYFTTEFMGHTRACDLLQVFKQATATLDLAQLLQISMDGPAVNWKFIRQMDESRTESGLPKLLNVGSCSLHVIHGALQHGLQGTGWKLDSLLRSIFYIFNESPAQREEYKKITGQTKFGLNFSSTRWVEDVNVAERALEIWHDIKKYVKEMQKRKKSEIPTNRSFQNLQQSVRDSLVPAKLHFFIYVAKVVKPFLQVYQSDNPLMPFISCDLKQILQSLYTKFVKAETLNDATTGIKLVELDIDKKENLKLPKDVEIGFAAKQVLDEIGATAKQKLDFNNDCMSVLQRMCKKISERCPLKYSLVRNLNCLDPRFLVSHEQQAVNKFSYILKTLLEHKWFNPEMCDTMKEEFREVISDLIQYYKVECQSFQPEKESLDKFFIDKIGGDHRRKNAWKCIKLLLILSHGQAAVERGFSTNKDVLQHNMKPETLKACRIVCDAVKTSKCNIEDMEITKDMLTSCKLARSRYMAKLDDQKKESKNEELQRKRKQKTDELKNIKKRKTEMEKTINELLSDADKYARDAENKNKMSLLIKSNALRSKVSEKKKELQTIEEKIENVEKEINL